MYKTPKNCRLFTLNNAVLVIGHCRQGYIKNMRLFLSYGSLIIRTLFRKAWPPLFFPKKKESITRAIEGPQVYSPARLGLGHSAFSFLNSSIVGTFYRFVLTLIHREGGHSFLPADRRSTVHIFRASSTKVCCVLLDLCWPLVTKLHAWIMLWLTMRCLCKAIEGTPVWKSLSGFIEPRGSVH